MKFIDRVLQDFRISQAKKFIHKGSSVLDIGSVDGILFKELGSLINDGVGIDPTLAATVKGKNYILYPGYFPKDLPQERRFDVITMLAVLEHIPLDTQSLFSTGCSQFLRPGGRLIITVPSPKVDYILDVLRFLKVIDGMSLEEHFGYDIKTTDKIFAPPEFKLIKHATFQFGLNNLFVFERV